MVQHPLVVDLDGTLIHTDLLHESMLQIFRNNPLDILRAAYWISKGKAALKRHLASRVDFDPKTLPYNKELLEWLKNQRASGRQLILCTASDLSLADPIAKHLGLFDKVIASDGRHNIAGKTKAEILEQQFGRSGFDYVGNSEVDLSVWERAHQAIVVNATNSLTKKAEKLCEIARVFPRAKRGFSAWARVIRTHQWLKNLLLFVPLFASHELTNIAAWKVLILAFFPSGFVHPPYILSTICLILRAIDGIRTSDIGHFPLA